MLLCKWGLDYLYSTGPFTIKLYNYSLFFYFSEINASSHSVADSYHCVHFNIALT